MVIPGYKIQSNFFVYKKTPPSEQWQGRDKKPTKAEANQHAANLISEGFIARVFQFDDPVKIVN